MRPGESTCGPGSAPATGIFRWNASRPFWGPWRREAHRIKLTDSLLMMPSKSVTAVMGISKSRTAATSGAARPAARRTAPTGGRMRIGLAVRAGISAVRHSFAVGQPFRRPSIENGTQPWAVPQYKEEEKNDTFLTVITARARTSAF